MSGEQGFSAGRFTCPACPERFTALGDKKRHVRAEHQTRGSTPTPEQEHPTP